MISLVPSPRAIGTTTITTLTRYTFHTATATSLPWGRNLLAETLFCACGWFVCERTFYMEAPPRWMWLDMVVGVVRVVGVAQMLVVSTAGCSSLLVHILFFFAASLLLSRIHPPVQCIQHTTVPNLPKTFPSLACLTLATFLEKHSIGHLL